MDLSAHEIGHRYGALSVISDVTFTVAAGEIVVVMGPSGCGKSTLLRILGGMERPTSGEASTRGEPTEGCLNAFTYVLQDPSLLPWRTVAGNVSLPLEHHALSRAARARLVETALARVGLHQFAESYPRHLSGGMRQRVNLARALIVKPAILLLDEPFSALDRQTRDEFARDLLRLREDIRFTAVYVTHSIEEAVMLATRVIVLSPRPARIKASLDIMVPAAERAPYHPALLDAQVTIAKLMAEETALAPVSHVPV